MSNVDVSYPTPKQVHTLVFDRGTWFPFADPIQTGWIIGIKILSLYVVTGQQHTVRKVVNSGTGCALTSLRRKTSSYPRVTCLRQTTPGREF